MHRFKGLTTAELIIVLAISAILASYAASNLTQLLAKNRQTGKINNLVTSLLLARSHAITKHDYVLLCPSADGQTCDDSRLWQHGWLVRAASTEAEVLRPDSGAVILRIESASPNLSISVNRDYFLYRPFARRSSNGTFVICTTHTDIPGKAVIVSYTGRPRVSRRMSDGSPVRCDGD